MSSHSSPSHAGQTASQNSGTPSHPDDLTVLVFKDNSVARTFRVPLQWISRLGLIMGIITGVAILGVFLSTRFFLVAHQALKAGDPGYVQAIENENATLKSSLKQAQAQAAQQFTAQTTAAQTAPAIGPIPTVTVTVTATPLQAAPVAPQKTEQPQAVAGGPGFSAFPTTITPEFTNSPIDVYEPKIKWVGKTLQVQFFIQYTREDKGNQQGRIILLARGPQAVLGYPAAIFNNSEASSLVDPEKGEYFSVSRIREVKTDFGPMRTTSDLNSIEVYLVSSDQKLLVHQILKVQAPAAPAPVKRSAPVKQEEDTSDGTTDEATPKTSDTPATAVAPATATPAPAASSNATLPGEQ